ncbi:menaquinone-dependent protoporphyrinogen IX dehydrogenase [Litoribacter populi]|uniref:menaquinone-dependent protoporphyrinogen IX dehydrogenase n=1 Tax=Litoribacter populi TaxID=2598460 RepID=UPI00117C9C4C|nr:menaquinone-dependent protoporphyrinogen IX dehydrogenase [Litoribacter populi]
MSAKTLILYSSVDGQTLDICGRIKIHLEEKGHVVNLISIQNPPSSLTGYQKIILASSIRYGKHNQELSAYINEHHVLLNQKPSAFVSVNLVARKENKTSAETNPYVKKFLSQIEWKPTMVGVFAGKLDYSKYTFGDKWLIRLIMLLTNGPIFPPIAMEFTNWERVKAFSVSFSKL